MAEYLRKRYSVGLRRICGRLQMARSTMYYESQGREDEALREALKETAIKRRRWGYRMLSLILGRRAARLPGQPQTDLSNLPRGRAPGKEKEQARDGEVAG